MITSRYGSDIADDTYGVHAYPEIPIAELLIPNQTYEAWLAQGIDVVDRQRVDLILKYLPQHFLKYTYCEQDQGLPPDSAAPDQNENLSIF
jgi:hypothetical protein